MSVIANSLQIENVCRTCLSEEPNMKSVFDTDCNSGDGLQLYQMLMACTSIQVTEDDGLPAQICFACINYVARSFIFKKLCEDSDATLRKLLGKSTINDEPYKLKLINESSSDVSVCSQETLADIDPHLLDEAMKFEEGKTHIGDLSNFFCGQYEVSPTEYTIDNCDPNGSQMIDRKPDYINDDLRHDQIDLETNILLNETENRTSQMPDDETQQTIYPCEQCTDCFTLESDLRHHSNTHSRVNCNHCSAEFTSSIKLTKHMKEMHGDERPHMCSECNASFKHRFELRTHLRTHTGEKAFVCKLCGKRYTHASGLSRHKMQVHPHEYRKFICADCGMHFTQRTDIIAHVQTHQRPIEKICVCSVCGQQLASESKLSEHMRNHSRAKNHVCSYCEKSFTSSSYLLIHQRKHTGENLFTCNVCEQGFVRLGTLKRHMVVHTGEKPFKCNLCPKAFTRSAEVRLHIKRHKGERAIVCGVCGKGFFTSMELRQHMRIHTGEKPYKCNVCPKTFALRTQLTTHIKRHTGTRDHRCVHCKMEFYEACSLKAHLRVHTGERPYTCKICNKSFKRANALKIHLKIH